MTSQKIGKLPDEYQCVDLSYCNSTGVQVEEALKENVLNSKLNNILQFRFLAHLRLYWLQNYFVTVVVWDGACMYHLAILEVSYRLILVDC